MNLAPIILFVYNRLWHTQQTVEALQKNDLASQSELFIYADGAKQENDTKVQEVRKYIKTIDGFKQITIIEREKNWGLADNIIDGVTTIVNQFGRVIVLEDDLLTSQYFLQYMNDALTSYQKEQNVYGISGYSFYPDSKLPETFFLPLGSSWGWATWKRAWQDFESNSTKLITEIKAKKLEKEFDFGDYPYFNMLNEQANGKVNSWAIRFYASYFLKKGLFLHPKYSLIKNNGFDKEATHTKEDTFFENKLFNVKVNVKEILIKADKKATTFIKKHIKKSIINKQPKPNMIKRNIQKVIQKVIQKLILILTSDEGFINKVDKKIKEKHLTKISSQIILGNKSNLYESATILNLQNDKEKISIGENTHIRGELIVFKSGGHIKIGSNCFLGLNSKIWSQENIFIGNNVLISHNVNIHDTNSHPTNYLERREDFKQIIKEGFSKTNTNIKTAAIYIDDDVWIGFNSTILKGVKIGKGAIVATGSFVTKDIPAWTVVGGNPAKIIKKLK